MLYTNFTEKLIGLQDLIVKNIEKIDNKVVISGEMPRKAHICPACGCETNTIHDYRKQKIKDIPAFGNMIEIVLNKRRYKCKNCNKKFYEKISFLPRYYRLTNRLASFIIANLDDTCSFTSVANKVNLSVSTVIRIFDKVSYHSHAKLSKALSIDEFKGDTGSEKYQCIITDPVNHTILDILPNRHNVYLTDYFNKYTPEERKKVEYFVSDMWRPYSDISDVFFKSSMFVVDKYHWIRQIIWAFENIRKEEQKKFSKTHRKCFKRSKRLLLKRYNKLTSEQKEQVNSMLYISPILSIAYSFKESFMDILDCKNSEDAKKAMSKWIYDAQNTNIKALVKCANTLVNWSKGILNSFESPYTNGFVEGCNNKIKVLKRNAYGYKSFERFRKRILHMFNSKKTTIIQ